MANMDIYEQVKEVPKNAQKTIQAGRLKGMTDINPMWRIEKLTEVFGPCGIGWYTVITEQWIEEGANGVKCAFVKINLFIKHDGEWSKPIEGVGGSSFIASQKNELYTSDECYKMAYTDAISVACKALGFGANIYWQKNETKYDKQEEEKSPTFMMTDEMALTVMALLKESAELNNIPYEDMLNDVLKEYKINELKKLDEAKYAHLLNRLKKALPKNQ